MLYEEPPRIGIYLVIAAVVVVVAIVLVMVGSDTLQAFSPGDGGERLR